MGGTIDTNGFDSTFSGVVAGPGALTKAGKGTLILSADNTYIGITTIAAGTLQLGSFSLQGGSIVAANSGANGIVVGGTSAGLNVVTLSAASVVSTGSSLVAQGSTNSNITLNAGVTLVPANGTLFEGEGTGTVDLAMNNTALAGNLVVRSGLANVVLNSATLTGWINQNTLTGALGTNPADPGSALAPANLP